MRTRPYTDAHAIAAFELVLTFASPIEEDALLSLTEQAGRISTVLETVTRTESLPDGHPDPLIFNTAGIRIYSSGPDGRVTAALDVQDYLARFVLFDYLGWDYSSTVAKEALLNVRDTLREFGIKATNCGLRCIDRFILDSPDEYDFHEVFRSFPRYLPPMLSEVGSIWHADLGWYEPNDDRRRILSTFRARTTVEGTSHVTQLEHVVQHVRTTEEMLELSDTEITDAFERLHAINKRVVLNSLSEEMSKRIGLREG